MKYLDSYKLFTEKYTIINTDSPEISSAKTRVNKMQDDISEYNSKKGVLDNIYLTYIDSKDLSNKLQSQKFTIDNNFTNTLLGLYSQISSKNRKVKNLVDEINKGKKELTDISSNNSIKDNKDLQKSIQSDIDNIKRKINDKTKNISDLNKEISDLQKTISVSLSQMKTDLLDQQKIIDTDIKIT